jgi:hypothetical protein
MMIRIIMLCSLLLVSGAMIAQEKESVPTQEKSGDEGPVKLKKKKASTVEPQEKPKDPAIVPSDKNKPESNPEKKKDKDKDQDQGPQPPKEMDQPKDNLEEEEIFGRIGKNLKDVDDRLGNLELGEATLQKQRDILEDIDKLLKKNQNNQKDSQQSQSKSSSKSESSNKQPKGSPDNQDSNSNDSDKGQGQDKQKQGGPKQGQQGEDSGKQQKQGGQGKADPDGKPNAGKGQPKDMQGKGDKGSSEKSEVANQGKGDDTNSKSGDGGKSDPSKDKVNPAADVFKEAWGHLPETLRAELNAYGVPNQFMDRYDEMIRKYYAKVAEKGSRKK